MSAGYYNIDDILAEEEKIQCVFSTHAVGLGYLDDRSDELDLKEGAGVELPFWLTQALAVKNYAHFKLPRYFGERFRTHLLVDPSVVHLSDKCYYFYELGVKLALLINDSGIGSMLQKTLYARFHEILRRSPVHRSADFATFVSSLTNLERRLFDLKYYISHDHAAWQNRRSNKLKTNSILAHAKRKYM